MMFSAGMAVIFTVTLALFLCTDGESPRVRIKNMVEEINYNEHFDFGWDQQLNGFGPNGMFLCERLVRSATNIA